MQDLRPIKTETDYQTALKEIENLFSATPNTPEGDRLEILATLVDAYEDARYDIPAPDPIEAIHYHLESRGLTRRDLEPYLGSRARVSQILNRQRALSLGTIRQLHQGLGIPAEILLQPYRVRKSKARVVLQRTTSSRKRLQSPSPVLREAKAQYRTQRSRK
ncbi:MAG: helix-turn-helix domain-containing protein [Chloroflexi bacterium]|nr:helix-turn-helix domain-containing protein [Chloroflexota bacterium]MBI3740569.1 helix-turn-helix domain-containing protein [Chloroflexota bacterium]